MDYEWDGDYFDPDAVNPWDGEDRFPNDGPQYERAKRNPDDQIKLAIRFNHVVRETDAAWLISFGTIGDEWFPKSQCQVTGIYVICVPKWLLRKKMADNPDFRHIVQQGRGV